MFTQLPPEILLQIASWTASESDLASLAQVNRSLYQTLITELYIRNANNPHKSAIVLAAQSGNCSTLKKALQAWKITRGSAGLPTAPGSSRLTPLFTAVVKGYPAAVRVLLEYGVDPNVPDRAKRTPLNAASTLGHTAVVEILLAQPNIKLNEQTMDNSTPISGAAQNGHTEIVKTLLLAGAHLGSVRKGSDTPLHYAVLNKQHDLVRLLMNRKDVDPNAIGKTGTPLQLAVDANEPALVQLLLTDKRVEPDLTVRPLSQTPLLEAALKDNGTMVRLLLEAGANKAIQDRTFLSPAMLIDAPSAEARRQLIDEHNKTSLGLGIN